MNIIKRFLLCMSLLVIIITPTKSFAYSKLTDMNQYENLTQEILEEENYIVIDSPEKAIQVHRENLENLNLIRAKSLKDIPIELINEFNSFIKSKQLTNDKAFKSRDRDSYFQQILLSNQINSKDYTIRELTRDFNEFSNKTIITQIYKNDLNKLERDLDVLRTTFVEDMILSAFMAADMPVSYGMFLHSISSNSPKNLYYQTEGSNAYLGGFGNMNLSPSLKYGFYQNPSFIMKIANFSVMGNGETNQIVPNYEFNNGDLAYSIHGTTSFRIHRIHYNKSYWRFWDVYDFDGLLNKIINATTNSSEYGITVEGLYDRELK